MTDTDLPYRIETGDGYCAITLNAAGNDPRWSDIEAIGTRLVSLVEQSSSNAVLVDLSPLNYIGSAMIAVIVRVWKSVKGRDGRMVVVNRDSNVYEVLRISGLHNVWTIVESVEDGLSELGVSRKGRPARDEALPLAIVSPLAAVIAGGGLFLVISKTAWVSSLVAVCLTFGFAAVGLLVAALTLSRLSGVRKVAAYVSLVACVAILVAGGIFWPDDLRSSAADPHAAAGSPNGQAGQDTSGTGGLAESNPDERAFPQPISLSRPASSAVDPDPAKSDSEATPSESDLPRDETAPAPAGTQENSPSAEQGADEAPQPG